MRDRLTVADYRHLEDEAAFQAKILTLASTCGWLAYHPYDSRRAARGFPDLCLVRPASAGPPCLVFAELKSQGGRVRPEQRQWIAALAGISSPQVIVRLWRPDDWDEIVRILSHGPDARPEES